MRIIVSIKQVPDTTEVRVDPETNTLIREGVESIINPFDMYAIEEAVRLKEKHGAETIVITMGPPQAESALREALALGIDKAIHITDRAFAGSDTWATSYILAQAVKKIGEYDLIICGKQASDGDTAQVGPGMAAHLDLPQIAYVKKIEEISQEKKMIVAERLVEDGFETLKAPLPCLITVVKEINEPRLPSLRGKMRAKKAEIVKWNKDAIGVEEDKIGLRGSPTQVVKIFTPPQKKGGEIWQGEPEELGARLAKELKKYL
ncbi:MAG: electron transfer flavoprotein subunit beta/FixA family protein [Candidatus Omnitrophica bacterium]|nr:electron transfer flavoprotein subunit beta/FixA family protein [Candidatus Omnitrophota bacterium]